MGHYLPTDRIRYPDQCEEVDTAFSSRFRTSVIRDGQVQRQLLQQLYTDKTLGASSPSHFLRMPDEESGYVLSENSLEGVLLSNHLPAPSEPCGALDLMNQLFDLGNPARFLEVFDRMTSPVLVNPSENVQ